MKKSFKFSSVFIISCLLVGESGSVFFIGVFWGLLLLPKGEAQNPTALGLSIFSFSALIGPFPSSQFQPRRVLQPRRASSPRHLPSRPIQICIGILRMGKQSYDAKVTRFFPFLDRESSGSRSVNQRRSHSGAPRRFLGDCAETHVGTRVRWLAALCCIPPSRACPRECRRCGRDFPAHHLTFEATPRRTDGRLQASRPLASHHPRGGLLNGCTTERNLLAHFTSRWRGGCEAT